MAVAELGVAVDEVLVGDGEIKRVYITVLAAQGMAQGLTRRLVQLGAASVGGVRVLIEFGAPVVVQELRSPGCERALGLHITPADGGIGSLVGLVDIRCTSPVGIERDNLRAERLGSGIVPGLRGIPLPIDGLRFGPRDALFQANRS